MMNFNTDSKFSTKKPRRELVVKEDNIHHNKEGHFIDRASRDRHNNLFLTEVEGQIEERQKRQPKVNLHRAEQQENNKRCYTAITLIDFIRVQVIEI